MAAAAETAVYGSFITVANQLLLLGNVVVPPSSSRLLPSSYDNTLMQECLSHLSPSEYSDQQYKIGCCTVRFLKQYLLSGFVRDWAFLKFLLKASCLTNDKKFYFYFHCNDSCPRLRSLQIFVTVLLFFRTKLFPCLGRPGLEWTSRPLGQEQPVPGQPRARGRVLSGSCWTDF